MKGVSFRARLGMGLGLLLLLMLGVGAVSIVMTRSILASKEQVLAHADNLVDAVELRTHVTEKIASSRAYLLSGHSSHLAETEEAHRALARTLSEMGERAASDDARSILRAITEAEVAHDRALRALLTERPEALDLDDTSDRFDAELAPLRRAMDERLGQYIRFEQEALAESRARALDTANYATNALIVILAAAAALSLAGGVLLANSLSEQVHAEVRLVRASSTDLQSAAAQQAAGAREQAAAMSDLARRMEELLASSQRIAETAHLVAANTATMADRARRGGEAVGANEGSVGAIRTRVDAILGHMLELGKKSEQIGSILELVTELAEQTNILAINAAIEAAGAGEHGRRFGVVADEIRKLADRVGASTKVIQSLVYDVRSSVNATVLATEAASKAVDGGSGEMSGLAEEFQRIEELIRSSADAAREIELGTREQASAVGQASTGLAQVMQLVCELEAAATRTLQTASALTPVSARLASIVSRQEPAA